MRRIKKEFAFQFNKQQIEVKLLGGVYCAIFGDTAKPIKVEFSTPDTIHIGRIDTFEGKFLSWLPEEATEEITEKAALIEIKSLINRLNF